MWTVFFDNFRLLENELIVHLFFGIISATLSLTLLSISDVRDKFWWLVIDSKTRLNIQMVGILLRWYFYCFETLVISPRGKLPSICKLIRVDTISFLSYFSKLNLLPLFPMLFIIISVVIGTFDISRTKLYTHYID